MSEVSRVSEMTLMIIQVAASDCEGRKEITPTAAARLKVKELRIYRILMTSM